MRRVLILIVAEHSGGAPGPGVAQRVSRANLRWSPRRAEPDTRLVRGLVNADTAAWGFVPQDARPQRHRPPVLLPQPRSAQGGR